MKKIKILYLFSLLFTTVFQPNTFLYSMGTEYEMSDDLMDFPDLTPEQLAQLEQEITAEIEREVEKMSPEEQAQFFSMVEKVEQMPEQDLERFISGQMSEDELEDFLTEIMPEDMLKQLEDQEELDQADIQEEDVFKKEEPAFKSKYDQALSMINTIIKSTDSFLLKISSLPEIDGKIIRWIKKGQVSHWEPTSKWEKINADITQIIQKLRTIYQSDFESKDPKYLEALIADEALYNNLNKLKDVVKTNEEKIEISPFGFEQMAPNSKKAMQTILNQYGEAFTLLKIQESLDKVFAGYEPIAKKEREKELAAEKKALAEGRKPRKVERMRVAGKAPEVPTYYPDTFDYDDYTYAPPAYEPSRPSYKPTVRPSVSKPELKPKEPAKGPTPAGKPKKDEKKDKKPDDKKQPPVPGRRPTLKEQQAKKAAEVRKKEPRKVTRLINNFADELSEAEAIADQNKNLSKLSKHFSDPKEKIDQTLLQSTIPQIIVHLESAIANMEQLKKLVKKEDLRSYKPELEKSLKDELKTLSKVEKELGKKKPVIFGKGKKEAYFPAKEKPTPEKPTPTKPTDEKPAAPKVPTKSFADLKEVFGKLRKTLKEFTKKK